MNRSKRKAFRSYPTQQSGLFSVTPMRTPKQPLPESDGLCSLQNAKLSIIKLIEYARLMKLFKDSVKRFKGTNEPVSYRSDYEFSERWQETSKVKYQRNHNLLISANSFCFFVAIVVMIHKIPLIWFLSIEKIFGIPQNAIWMVTGICIILVDISLKIFLLLNEAIKNTQTSHSQKKEILRQIIYLIFGDVLAIIIFSIQLKNQQFSFIMLILQSVVVIMQSLRFYEIYNSMTIILIAYKYKNYVNLFGFVSKILVILHFHSKTCVTQAIVMFSLTFVDGQKNWLESIQLEDHSPMVIYIYSLYFTATTMFTVGYGDILPQNIYQILMIILIQLIGIILTGYIVSQIGHTLTTIRQNQQQFEHDIQNTDKICEYYQLNEDLKQRVRNYIVNHQLANQQLNINEENHFLMKLNEDLRNQVKHANHLNIIKTNLFFLCNWSKKMQTELSKKLEKFIFSPNQRIVNKDKLFIVTKGKIDVFIERKVGNKVYVKKFLKSVQKSHQKQVYSNAYGYVSLFTGRPSRLTAVSKDFTICYALNFQDILDTVRQDERDFQYYHETKTNLEQQKIPQKFQVSNLINNRQHFCPTKLVVLKKYKKEFQAYNQERNYILRNNRRKKKVVTEQKQADIDDSDSDCVLSNQEESIREKLEPKKKVTIAPNRDKNFHPSFVSFRSYLRKHFFKSSNDDKSKQEQLKRLLTQDIVKTSYFEVGREYSRYFKKGNRQAVLSNSNKDQIRQFNAVNSKLMPMQWIDIIILANKLHKTQMQKTAITLT